MTTKLWALALIVGLSSFTVACDVANESEVEGSEQPQGVEEDEAEETGEDGDNENNEAGEED